MDTRTAHFVERMGLALEADGLPRIAGRIFGLLLVSEEPRSLDELAAELRVSKASVSTNARLLEHRGVLEQVSRPADRRDYYRIPRGSLHPYHGPAAGSLAALSGRDWRCPCHRTPSEAVRSWIG